MLTSTWDGKRSEAINQAPSDKKQKEPQKWINKNQEKKEKLLIEPQWYSVAIEMWQEFLRASATLLKTMQ